MNGVKEKQANVNVTANGKKLYTGNNMYYTLYKKRLYKVFELLKFL